MLDKKLASTHGQPGRPSTWHWTCTSCQSTPTARWDFMSATRRLRCQSWGIWEISQDQNRITHTHTNTHTHTHTHAGSLILWQVAKYVMQLGILSNVVCNFHCSLQSPWCSWIVSPLRCNHFTSGKSAFTKRPRKLLCVLDMMLSINSRTLGSWTRMGENSKSKTANKGKTAKPCWSALHISLPILPPPYVATTVKTRFSTK